MKTRTPLLLVGWILTLPATLAAQVLRSAPEFQVNVHTTGIQDLPAVARGPAGGFVVVWSSDGQDGDAHGIFGRRFDADGTALGIDFQVNQHATGSQTRPDIASDSSGNFVVVWHSYDQDGDEAGIFARRYDGAGTPLANEFQVNVHTTANQTLPDVAMDGPGNFVIVWTSYGQDGDRNGVFGRRFDSTGAPLTGDFQVNTYTTHHQARPGVAVDADGDFVVTWTDFAGQDGDSTGIFARPYDNAGAPLGPAFQVNTFTTGAQYGAAGGGIASDSPGTFVITWRTSPGDGDGYAVSARRFDETGAPLIGQFTVNTYTTGDQYPLAIASAGDGDFIVSWVSVGQDGSGPGSIAKRYRITFNNPFDGGFQVNEYTTGTQRTTSAILDAAGNMVFATVSDGQDGDQGGIFAQRFVAPRLIAGKRMLVKDPDGSETARLAVIFGTERPSDLNGIAGDPVANGASLRVIITGTTPSDETYALDAEGWRAIPRGFRYSGPTGIDGDPVKRVTIKYASTGTALLKALLKGTVGTQPLNVVPPIDLHRAGLVFRINGGGSAYCIAFGVGPGATIYADTATTLRLANSGNDCP